MPGCGSGSVLRPGRTGPDRWRHSNGSTRPVLPASARVDTPRPSWQVELKTGNSTAAHREGARHTACSQPRPRADFKALQPRTARGFQSSGILEACPPTAGRLVNEQKWRKNFQNVIYTHVCRSHVCCADTCPIRRKTHDRFFCQIASVSALRKVRDRVSQPRRTRVSDNRTLRGYGRVRCCFSCIADGPRLMVPHLGAKRLGAAVNQC